MDRDAVVAALRAANGNVGKAAKMLGCARRTLQNRMRKYGLARGQSGRPSMRLHFHAHRRAGSLGLVAAAALIGGGLYLASHRSAA